MFNKFHFSLPYFFIVLTICFNHFSCTNTNTIGKNDAFSCKTLPTEDEVNIKNIVLVFCDFTTSLNKENVKKISTDANKIIKKMPDNSKIAFYKISDEGYEQPFFEYDIVKSASRPSEREKSKKHILCMADSIQNTILSMGEIEIQKDKDKAKSCILRSLKEADTAFRAFGNRDKSKYKFKIIILSDMIEECKTSLVSSGNLFLREKKFNDIKKTIQNLNLSFDLSYSSIDIILSSSSNNSEDYHLKNEKLEIVWSMLLSKCGFTDDAIKSTIPFSSSVPVLNF